MTATAHAPTAKPDALVAGLGSIGQRHARLLAELGLTVRTVSRRAGGDFATLGDALTAGPHPAYIVLATETARHGDDLAELVRLGFTGRVLVEKPLLSPPQQMPEHQFAALLVGYNLRFHPAIQWLRHKIENERILSARFAVGQLLSDWRPGRNSHDTSSARRAQGGGVLRDLSHELDLALWLLGDWQRVTAATGRLSDQTIDSEDSAQLLLTTAHCPLVSLSLDYLNRPGLRQIVIETDRHSLRADLVDGWVSCDGWREDISCPRDATYQALHRDALGKMRQSCVQAQAQQVLDLISAAETAAAGERWIRRET